MFIAPNHPNHYNLLFDEAYARYGTDFPRKGILNDEFVATSSFFKTCKLSIYVATQADLDNWQKLYYTSATLGAYKKKT